MHHNSLLVITGIERDGVNLAANPVFAWVQIDFRTTLKRLCPSSCGTDGKPAMRQCRVMILSLRSLMRFPGAGKEASRSSYLHGALRMCQLAVCRNGRSLPTNASPPLLVHGGNCGPRCCSCNSHTMPTPVHYRRQPAATNCNAAVLCGASQINKPSRAHATVGPGGSGP